MYGMDFENRFIPLLARPFITVENRPSHMMLDAFFATASQAFGFTGENVGIQELYGNYDQRDVALGLVALGFQNPLPSEFQGMDLPWIMNGRIQAQGLVWQYEQEVAGPFMVGASWYLMRVNSRPEFFFKKSEASRLTQAQVDQLTLIRLSMNSMLGLTSQHFHSAGWGDLETYIRFWDEWYYTFKFRHIQAGLDIGAVLPIGLRKDINIPASIPFGSNGFYGIYASVDAEFEVKEDWKVDLLLRVNKFLPRTCIQRMPVGPEPITYGAVVGPARINPGFTFIFSPAVLFENLRDGLAARVLYTMTLHTKDEWCDARANKCVPVCLKPVTEGSSWASDYFTLNVLYDFGKVKVIRGFEPIVSFAWDIPASLVVGRNYSKTNRISLGFELNF